MSNLIGTIVVVLGLVTFATALPAVRLSREAVAPQIKTPISVLQWPETGDGYGAVKNTTTYTKECIPVVNTLLPTAVALNPPVQPGSYRLQKLRSSCSETDETVGSPVNIDMDGVLSLNEREPICSFELGNLSGKGIDVGFIGNLSSFVFESLKDTSCHDLCTRHPWSRYALSVALRTKHGREANNFLRLYTDSGCKKVLSQEVRHGANLVDLTLKDKANVVQSFMILREEDDNTNM